MFGCRKIRGLIAESVYQDLVDPDRVKLERHTTTCPACREEAHALSAMVQRIPQVDVPLEKDLVPLLRARLREETASTAAPAGMGLRYAGALSFVLLAAFLGYAFLSGEPQNTPPVEVAKVSPLQPTLDAAVEMLVSNNFTGAYLALDKGLVDYPEDSLTGDARRMQADLAFSELRWYREALGAYETLRSQHWESFKDDRESKERLDLLAQARGADGAFRSLHALDEARLTGSFDGLEDVVSAYPTTFVASLAAKEMAILSVESEQPGNERVTDVFAMEAALDRCSHPSAIAQLQMELGSLLAVEAVDPARARALFQKVALSEIPELARLARISLSKLEEVD